MGGQGLDFASSLHGVREQNLNNVYHELLTSQCAPDMVPIRRPAAPEMVPRPAAVGETPSPDGRVPFDLASSCLAYGVFVARDRQHVWFSSEICPLLLESSRQIRMVTGLLVFRKCCILMRPIVFYGKKASSNWGAYRVPLFNMCVCLSACLSVCHRTAHHHRGGANKLELGRGA